MSETAEMVKALRCALRLVDNPRRWTRQWFARDGRGQHVPPDHPRACRWCADGALQKCAGPLPNDGLYDKLRDAVDARVKKLYPKAADNNIVALNDGEDGRRRVARVFRRTLQDLELEKDFESERS